MELQSLLHNSGWERSTLDYSLDRIEQNTRSEINRNIKKLISNHYKGLALNVAFLLITVLFYVLNPVVDYLVPVVLIGGCFLFITVSLVIGISGKEKIDYTQPMVAVLSNVLNYNNQVYSRHCNYYSALMTTSFVGGFLLGILVQGWTFKMMTEKPVIFVILGALSTGFYFLSKTTSFRKMNRIFNPDYFKSKKYLEEQLTLLEN